MVSDHRRHRGTVGRPEFLEFVNEGFLVIAGSSRGFKHYGTLEVRVQPTRSPVAGANEHAKALISRVLPIEDGYLRMKRAVSAGAEHKAVAIGVELDRPSLIVERGEIDMSYRTRDGVGLDLSSAGRGMQQTLLLLLSFLSLNPGATVLLAEPDAHLEILRQRQTYQVLTDAAAEERSQVLVASHSEVLLNEAADRDVVVAFVGKPHRIDDRGSQVLKALKEIGFEDYYQAEITGWVLYLEGSTDLAVLRGFARALDHPARQILDRPFVHYVANLPARAREHFYGLLEAKPELVGFALFDRLDLPVSERPELAERQWARREVENYPCQPETLIAFAESTAGLDVDGPLFELGERDRRRGVMEDCIRDRVPPAALRDREDRFWVDVKASDDLLDPIFAAFYTRLGGEDLMRKTDYHRLVPFVPEEVIDPEVAEVLDAVVAVAGRAVPVSG